MLLNIVRLSEHEPTQWMTVSQVVMSTKVGGKLNGKAIIPVSGFVDGETGGETSFEYSPTITMLPKQGDQLARELMSPIPVSSIESLVSASWPISWVVFLACEQFQSLTSFDVTRGFTTHVHDHRFGTLMMLFDELQSKHLISLSLTPLPVIWNAKPIPEAEVSLDSVVDAKKERSSLKARENGTYDYVSIESVPVFTMYEGIQNNAKGLEMIKLLSLPNEPGNYRMLSAEKPLPGTSISMRTRSFSAVLNLLSAGVDKVSNESLANLDINSSVKLWSRIAAQPDAEIDMRLSVNSVFRVHRGTSAPSNASVRIEYRGQCFWIANNDEKSKQIFALLRDLFDLQMKSGNEALPVLTIPVGR